MVVPHKDRGHSVNEFVKVGLGKEMVHLLLVQFLQIFLRNLADALGSIGVVQGRLRAGPQIIFSTVQIYLVPQEKEEIHGAFRVSILNVSQYLEWSKTRIQ